jgi:hypothetical protein
MNENQALQFRDNAIAAFLIVVLLLISSFPDFFEKMRQLLLPPLLF